jgi:hypothetical protein
MLMKYFSICAMVFLVMVDVVSEAKETNSIGYPSVKAAFDELKKDIYAEPVKEPTGETTYYQVEGRDAVMWSFVPAGHPAYPLVIKRIQRYQDRTSIRMVGSLCEGEKSACEKVINDFRVRDKQAAEARREENKKKGNSLDPNFMAAVAKEANGVFPQTDLFRLVPTEEPNPWFALYGKNDNGFITFDCVKSAVFSVVSAGGEVGTLAVATCRDQGPSMPENVKDTARRVETSINRIKKADTKMDDDRVKKLGWFYTKEVHDGMELHYFPFFFGPVAMPTVVLMGKGDPILIQASMGHFCEDKNSDLKFCANTKDALFDLAKRVHKNLPKSWLKNLLGYKTF